MNCRKCGAALPEDARFCNQCSAPVALVSSRRVDVPGDIAKRAEDFAGRLWVLEKVLDWLDKGHERFFLLTGKPGCGKTTLAAWLAGAGLVPGEAEAARNLERVRDTWKAAHFCLAEERRGTVDPARFIQSLARQLAERHEDYAKAALKRLSPEITISQQVQENWGLVVGAQIEMIIHENVEGIYQRAVREPLEVLCQRQPHLRLFILVDALDEALTYGSPNIVTLLAGSGDLPAGVRFLLTSRNENKVIDQFKGKRRRVNLSSQENKAKADDDIRTYVGKRLAAEPLKQLVPDPGGEIIDRLVDKADGNFLYGQFFLDEVAAGNRSLAGLEGLPKGLYGLYRTFLDRLMPEMLQVNASQRWLDHYQPLLGCLSVAVPSAPLSVLPGWLGWPESEVTARLSDLMQVTECDLREGGGCRLYHRSMAEFLASKTYEEEGTPTLNRYYTPPGEQHRRIIAFYRGNVQSWNSVPWLQKDDYGLRNLTAHLHSLREDEASRQEFQELVQAAPFYQERLKRWPNPGPVLEDLRLALELALQYEDLANIWNNIRLYRKIWRNEQNFWHISNAVSQKKFEQALERTNLYASWPNSQVLARLWIAWEAAAQGKMDEAAAAAREGLASINLRKKKEDIHDFLAPPPDPFSFDHNNVLWGMRTGQGAEKILYKKVNAMGEAFERLLVRLARAISDDIGGQRDWLREIAASWPEHQVTAITRRLTENVNSWGIAFEAHLLNKSIQKLLEELREQRRRAEEPTKVREQTFSYQRQLAGGLFKSRQEPGWNQYVSEVVEIISLDDYPSYRELALAWIAAAVLTHEDDATARGALAVVLSRLFSASATGFWGDIIASAMEGRARELDQELKTEDLLGNLKGTPPIDASIELHFEQKAEERERANLPQDPWCLQMRRRSAVAAVLPRRQKLGDIDKAEALLEEAGRRDQDPKESYAGFRVLARLSLACRWLEWGRLERAREQMEAAREDGQHMLDVVLRRERLDLIEQMEEWLADFGGDPANLAEREALEQARKLTGMRHNLYLEFLSAIWHQDANRLKKLVPLGMEDATVADAVLGRWLGLLAKEKRPGEPFAKLLTAMGLDGRVRYWIG